jgi:transposase
MAIALPDARQLPDEALEVLRLRALKGCELGFSQSDMADILGVARETVCRWWAAFVSGGVEALPGDRTGRPEGSGRTLTDEQCTHIQRLIDENSPKDLGIAAPLWNRRAVRDLIQKEYGIDMPVRTVGEYLKRWGYTSKKPARHANDQDPEAVREWLEETYPDIERQAEKEDAVILWCDESGVEADHCPCTGYAPKGERATMEVRVSLHDLHRHA